MSKININGIFFDNVTRAEAADLAENALLGDACKLVVTPNAEIAYNAICDKAFFDILSSAEIILPDGAGIIKASKILHTPLKEKVAGVDFGYDVARLCSKLGVSLFILGGKPNVAKNAAEKLTNLYPRLEVSGAEDGYFQKNGDENDIIIEKINRSHATALFVCLGSPTQEVWACQNRAKLKHVKLICCLGGSVDVYSENVKRAPKIFIKARLEWFYRLLKEPKRFSRMIVIPKYFSEIRKIKK